MIFNFDYHRNNNQTFNAKYPFVNSEVLNGIDFIKNYCIGHFAEISPIWTQVYKKEFLDKNNIFSPPINMGEDVPFTYKSLLLAKRIKSITDSYYVYRVNELSLTGANKTSPIAQKVYENCFICSKYMYDVTLFIPKSEKVIYNAYLEIVKHILLQFPTTIGKLSTTESTKLKSIIRKNLFNNYWIYKVVNSRFLFFYLHYVIK